LYSGSSLLGSRPAYTGEAITSRSSGPKRRSSSRSPGLVKGMYSGSRPSLRPSSSATYRAIFSAPPVGLKYSAYSFLTVIKMPPFQRLPPLYPRSREKTRLNESLICFPGKLCYTMMDEKFPWERMNKIGEI
jgi:hypothetical protein